MPVVLATAGTNKASALPDLPAPGQCLGQVDTAYQIQVQSQARRILISQGGAPARSVTLRAGLLPEVHLLPDGRHALFTTHDARVLRVDLFQARLVAEVRVGEMLGSAALSDACSGLPAVLAVANAQPHTLVLLDEHLQVIKQLPVTARDSKQTSGIKTLRTAGARDSFVMSLTDLPELWEVSYRPSAPEIALGMVHDFQYREGSFVPGYLNPQRIMLESPAVDFCLSSDGHEVLSLHANTSPELAQVGRPVTVTHLDVRRKVAELVLPAQTRLDQLIR